MPRRRASSRGASRLRPARPRHGRRLRLVAAAQARPAGPRPGQLPRRPAAPNHPAGPRLHAQRRLPLRPHPHPLPRHPVRRRRRADRQAGRQAGRHPGPRHLPQALPLLHLLLGRPRARRRHRRRRAATSCGSNCWARTATWSRRARCACTGRRAGRPRRAAQGRRRLSDVLAAAGVLARGRRQPPRRSCCRRVGPRSAAMLLALVLFPALILGDQWHSAQIVDLRDNTPRFAAARVAALVGRRSPRGASSTAGRSLLPLAIVAALPFRVPLHAGGDTANLLVPLYLVIAGGRALGGARRVAGVGGGPSAGGRPVFATARFAQRPQAARRKTHSRPAGPPTPAALGPGRGRSSLCAADAVLARLLEIAAERVLLLRAVLTGLRAAAGCGVGPEAACPRAVGDRRRGGRLRAGGTRRVLQPELFWNDQVIRSNEFHTYFRVNSIFWDPNIYGRYLALVIVVAMSALLWAKERRRWRC